MLDKDTKTATQIVITLLSSDSREKGSAATSQASSKTNLTRSTSREKLGLSRTDSTSQQSQPQSQQSHRAAQNSSKSSAQPSISSSSKSCSNPAKLPKPALISSNSDVDIESSPNDQSNSSNSNGSKNTASTSLKIIKPDGSSDNTGNENNKELFRSRSTKKNLSATTTTTTSFSNRPKSKSSEPDHYLKNSRQQKEQQLNPSIGGVLHPDGSSTELSGEDLPELKDQVSELSLSPSKSQQSLNINLPWQPATPSSANAINSETSVAANDLLPKLSELKHKKSSSSKEISKSTGKETKDIDDSINGVSAVYSAAVATATALAPNPTRKKSTSKINHAAVSTAVVAHPDPITMAIAAMRSGKDGPGVLSAYEICQHSSSLSQQRTYQLDDFKIIRRVGKGFFGSVFLARLKASSGRYYAVKAIKKSDLIKLKQEKQVMNEKNILIKIKHNFIVELHLTFQDTYYLYMIMEYIDGGDLFSYLRKVTRFSEEEAKFYIAEVFIALEYLHSQNIVFRDLKPENILLDTTGHIKLADFGFAKMIKSTTKSFCGTPDYIAPEIISAQPYSLSVDWWSLGVLTYELTSGKTPFADESAAKIYDNITHCRLNVNTYVLGTVREFCLDLLVVDPIKRLGSGKSGPDNIRAHAYFKNLKWKKVMARQTQPPFIPACQPPEAIERERTQKGMDGDEYSEILKNGGNPVSTDGAENTAAPDMSGSNFADVFSDTFKDF